VQPEATRGDGTGPRAPLSPRGPRPVNPRARARTGPLLSAAFAARDDGLGTRQAPSTAGRGLISDVRLSSVRTLCPVRPIFVARPRTPHQTNPGEHPHVRSDPRRARGPRGARGRRARRRRRSSCRGDERRRLAASRGRLTPGQGPRGRRAARRPRQPRRAPPTRRGRAPRRRPLAQGSDVFLDGVELAAFLDDEGEVSADLVAAAAKAAAEKRPGLAAPRPGFDGGVRGQATKHPGPSFAEGFRKAARR
jgi:hypothetical protein